MGKIRSMILAHKDRKEQQLEAAAEQERKEQEVVGEQQTQPKGSHAGASVSIEDRIAEENRWLEESQKRIRANEKEEEARDPAKYAAYRKAIQEKENSPEYAEWLRTREEIERVDRIRRIAERDKYLKAEQERKEREDKRIEEAIEQQKREEERQSTLARREKERLEALARERDFSEYLKRDERKQREKEISERESNRRKDERFEMEMKRLKYIWDSML